MTPRLVLATHNLGKVAELIEILQAEPALAALDPSAVVTAAALDVTPPVEDGTTFAENALIKARALAEATGLPAVADDSGLAVDLMGGAPGILSARWCGHHGDDAANLQLLLGQMGENLDPRQRRAKFVCAAALVTPDGEETVCIGEMPGYLATEPRGSGGFGYDPILIPDELPLLSAAQAGRLSSEAAVETPITGSRTAAELTPSEKNAISHRGKAFRKLAPAIARALEI